MKKITFMLMALLVTCCTWVTQAQTEIPQANATLTSGVDFVDGDIYTDSGGSLANYTSNEASTLDLVAGAGEIITISFTAFEVEASTGSSCFDNLTVVGDTGGGDATYSGDDDDAGAGLVCTDATDAAGAPTLGPFTSSEGGTLSFSFFSDGSVTDPGWTADITVTAVVAPVEIPQQDAVLMACADFVDGDIYTDSGGAAGDYGLNESSTLELQALPGETVSVTFTAFDVEATTTTCWDTLAVVGDAGGMNATYAGDDGDGGASLPCTDATDATGAPTLGPFTSAVGGSLSFTFNSDTSVTQSGWEAVIGVTGVCNVGMPPEIFCPADITENSDPGVCGGQVNFLGVAIDDEDGNISGDIVSTPFESGDVFPVGTTTVTLSVTDSDGNSAMCTFDVTVLDNEAPTITCPADITQTNDAGVCGANITVPLPTIMDNCPVVAGPPPPVVTGPETPFNYGPSGLIDTPTVLTGTVVSTGGDVTVTAMYDGDFSFSTEEFVLQGPDGATIVYSNAPATGADCTTFYTETFTIAEADWNNYVTTFGPDLTFTLLQDDDVDNFCLDASFQLSVAQGSVNGTLSNDYNGTNDASDFYPVGTTTVTWTYTDAAGFSASCTMDVTVTDDEAPVIVCAGAETPTLGSATEIVNTPIPDNDPAGLTSTLTVTDDFDITDLNVNLDINHSWIGDLIVTLTAPDGTTASVIVDRPGVPTSTVGCNNTVNDILVDMDDEAVDMIEEPCLTEYNGSFIPNEALSVFDGMSTLGDWTLFITDNAGLDTGSLNSWTLNYEYLAAAGPPADIVLDANGMATVNVIDLLTTVTDNCGMVTATTDVTGIAPGSITTLFDSNNGGSNGGAVYFDIAVDAGGDVTLTDLDLNTEEGGAFTVEMYTLVGTSVGNEGNAGAWTLAATGSGTASGTLNVPSNAVLDTQVVLTAGTTYGVALVMDATHGHSYSGTGTDPSPGMLMYSNSHMTLSLGSGSNAPFDGAPFTPRIWNGTLNYLANSTTPVPVEMIDLDCSDVGISTLDITVTDAAGNTSMCTATINVIDDTAPILVCQDFTLELGADGTAMLDPFDMIDMAASFEACGFDTAAVNIDDFTCADIGTPIEVTVFVADPSLNSAACTAFVTVVDLLGPEVTCPGDMTVDPGANNQLYEVPDYFGDGLATAVDNCTDPLTIFAQDPAPGSLIPDGVYTVTLSSTDEYGNVGSCTFELTVESILGVNDNNLDAGITMYPNPAQGQVTIANSSNILLEKATMYDVNGKLVNTTNLSDMQGEITIDISNLASGVYIVQIEGEDASVVKRLIKE
ncbi:HYR domain-containing protein [Rasiella rasia]|uniref:HYR domain-containing protein n=1 Tax=Rasiella rasia TaxID=2744027 RepID=A0A6G6GKN0_9FLAO|nr:HYR domain-containing protein [Rasiella rasia]QIE59135.1 HYR domain-containing protein [Rasiella rasia]